MKHAKQARRSPPVTDHAVLRWLERFAHVDVEAIRRRIHQEVRPALNKGATSLTINGTDYRMKNGVVVTLIDKRRSCKPLKFPKET